MSDPKATMTSPELRKMRQSWLLGIFLWHYGLMLLVISFIMQFVVIGTKELVVGETAVPFGTLPLYSTLRRTYGMWRSCFEIRGLFIPDMQESIGCSRPRNDCGNIDSLIQLNQGFGVLGVFFTLLAILVHIYGIARRGSCLITITATMVFGFLSMGFTMTIWSVAVGFKTNTFCNDTFPVLPGISREDYSYGSTFTIAVIGWILLVLYLINQFITMIVVAIQSKPIAEQVVAQEGEQTN